MSRLWRLFWFVFGLFVVAAPRRIMIQLLWRDDDMATVRVTWTTQLVANPRPGTPLPAWKVEVANAAGTAGSVLIADPAAREAVLDIGPGQDYTATVTRTDAAGVLADLTAISVAFSIADMIDGPLDVTVAVS